jgi:UDP-4-amino-4,6-dideoxy-N-acetyl-beta-L-altrosamine transaminase
MKVIPYGRQEITQEDIDAVVETLQSDYLTQGPAIPAFEQAFANYVGASYAVALSNGTAALHLSVLALGIEKDEYVICTPLTFAASVNCVRYCGGNVLFADIDPETYLMDIASVKELLEKHKDKKIKGIIPVDFAGRVAQLDEIKKLAVAHNMWLLEDACHAPGGYFIDQNGTKQLAGNGKFANAAIFSFHPVKHIATGEGGMITTNDKSLYEKLLLLRSHGITRNQEQFKNSIDFANGNATASHDNYPSWYMEMQSLGYNYRLTDFQAALGISQLKRANVNLEKRKSIAKTYIQELSDQKGIIRCLPFFEGHAYHLMVLEVENRRGLYDFLRKNNILCQIHYVPTHLMPYYKELGWKAGDLPIVEKYYSACISLPLYPSLDTTDVERIIQLIKDFYQ